MAKGTLKVGIVGGTGYTGVELLRLLAQHPHCEITAITSRQEAGQDVAGLFPNLRGREIMARLKNQNAFQELEEGGVLILRELRAFLQNLGIQGTGAPNLFIKPTVFLA